MSAITEISTIFDAVVLFLKNNSTYLLSGGTPPDVSTILGLEYDELLTYSRDNIRYPADFRVGSVQEAIFTAASITRELEMGKLGKSSIYNNMISEAELESEFYSTSGSFITGVCTGNPTTGSRS